MTIKVNSKFEDKEIARIEAMDKNQLVAESTLVGEKLVELTKNAYNTQKEDEGQESYIDWDLAAKHDKEGRKASDLQTLAMNYRDAICVINEALSKKVETEGYQNAINLSNQGKSVEFNGVQMQRNDIPQDLLSQLESLDKEGVKLEELGDLSNGVTQKLGNADLGHFLNVITTKSDSSLTTGLTTDKPRSNRLITAVDYPTEIAPLLPRYDVIAGGDSYTYPLEASGNRGGAAPKKEATAYASKDLNTSNVSVRAEKLTIISAVSDEQLADVRIARQWINNRLVENVRQEIEDQVIAGSGTAPNWDGIVTNSGATTVHREVVNSNASSREKRFDALIKGLKGMRVTARRPMPSFIALDGTTIEVLMKEKDSQGNYLWTNTVNGDHSRIIGVPIVVSNHLPSNVVATKKSSETDHFALFLYTPDFGLLMKKGIDMKYGYQDGDFSKGQSSIRVDVRGNVLAFRPASAVVVTGMVTDGFSS